MISADPASIAPDAAPTPTSAYAARGLIEGQLAMLSRLAEIGMEIAEACGRDAKAAPDELTSPRHPGLVFARVARAVRMTIALQSRLMKDLAALDHADAQAERKRKDDRRMRLRVLVGQAVSAGVSPDDDRDEEAIEDEIEHLADEAYERLTEAEDGDVWARPFDEVVAGVCKDLGLSPEWTARLRAAVEAPAAASAAGPLGREPDPPPQPEGWPEPGPPRPRSSGGAPKAGGTGNPALPP